MRHDLTEIVALLDRSRSMVDFADDAVEWYNRFIDGHKAAPGEVTVTTVLFNEKERLLQKRTPISEVKKIDRRDYAISGETALLDTLGRAIDELGAALRDTEEQNRPGRIIFYVITDGAENASKQFSQEKIREMVELQRNVYSWQFIFVMANIDAFAFAKEKGADIKAVPEKKAAPKLAAEKPAATAKPAVTKPAATAKPVTKPAATKPAAAKKKAGDKK
jgi:uncharacterized protein YegL